MLTAHPTLLPWHRRSRSGFTFVELMVSAVVLLVALMIFSTTVAGMGRQRAIARENAAAAWAASNVLESMRRENLEDVFALFNSDPGDDPIAGAPGNLFMVDGLEALDGAPGGMQGEILFATIEDPVEGLQLREDLPNALLGMPRDLSGDSIIDGLPKNDDYFLLPVCIRIRWTGKVGEREYELGTLLCQFEKTEP